VHGTARPCDCCGRRIILVCMCRSGGFGQRIARLLSATYGVQLATQSQDMQLHHGSVYCLRWRCTASKTPAHGALVSLRLLEFEPSPPLLAIRPPPRLKRCHLLVRSPISCKWNAESTYLWLVPPAFEGTYFKLQAVLVSDEGVVAASTAPTAPTPVAAGAAPPPPAAIRSTHSEALRPSRLWGGGGGGGGSGGGTSAAPPGAAPAGGTPAAASAASAGDAGATHKGISKIGVAAESLPHLAVAGVALGGGPGDDTSLSKLTQLADSLTGWLTISRPSAVVLQPLQHSIAAKRFWGSGSVTWQQGTRERIEIVTNGGISRVRVVLMRASDADGDSDGTAGRDGGASAPTKTEKKIKDKKDKRDKKDKAKKEKKEKKERKEKERKEKKEKKKKSWSTADPRAITDVSDGVAASEDAERSESLEESRGGGGNSDSDSGAGGDAVVMDDDVDPMRSVSVGDDATSRSPAVRSHPGRGPLPPLPPSEDDAALPTSTSPVAVTASTGAAPTTSTTAATADPRAVAPAPSGSGGIMSRVLPWRWGSRSSSPAVPAVTVTGLPAVTASTSPAAASTSPAVVSVAVHVTSTGSSSSSTAAIATTTSTAVAATAARSASVGGDGDRGGAGDELLTQPVGFQSSAAGDSREPAPPKKPVSSRVRGGVLVHVLVKEHAIGTDTTRSVCYCTVPKHLSGRFFVRVEGTCVFPSNDNSSDVVTADSIDVVIEDGAPCSLCAYDVARFLARGLV
jgi:hypothetical protein